MTTTTATAPSFAFTHKNLTPIVGRPDPVTIDVLRGEIYANAMDVPTELGGGQYGHLALVMPADQYTNLDNAIPYVAPINPGVQAPPAPNATAIQIMQGN